MLLYHSLRMHFIDLECARPIDFAMWAEIRKSPANVQGAATTATAFVWSDRTGAKLSSATLGAVLPDWLYS